MTQREAFERLETLDRQVVLMEHIGSTLSYDQEISLSELGVEERAAQLGWIAAREHELVSGSEMGDLLAVLDEKQAETPFEQALVRTRRREYEKQVKLPEELVRSISEQGAKAHQSWVKARKQCDWSVFSQDFSVMVDLVRRKAELLCTSDQCPYDALLDEFEEGMRTEQVRSLFGSIKHDLVGLVDRSSDQPVRTDFLFQPYPIDKQEQFARQVLSDMGFDFRRGGLSVTVHPFTTTVGADDIRITTRYSDPSVMDSFSSTIHEGGHALYEMGASQGRIKGTSLANGASFGLHESQSRLWENMIAKSPAFWEHYYPLFQNLFPDQTHAVSLEQFIRAVNKVERTPIRVNADEVSYSLHIMLRFELEQRILDGSVSIGELPEAWNELTRSLLGFTPKNVSEGVLQDVHWSSGDFGYFPTYALGNLYGAQFFQYAGEKLPIEDLLRSGKLGVIKDFLETEIYAQGAMHTGLQTLESVTKRALDATCFTSYLEGKFSRLFG
jgi:carboxypeptidase Taq